MWQYAAARVTVMRRVIVVAVAGLGLAGCSSFSLDSFKPTPEQITFAHLTLHIADSNTRFCSAISGVAAPEAPKLAETDAKDKVVSALKASFDFCSSSLAKVDDSHLADSIPLFPNRSFSRAGVMFILSGSWPDHYSAQSMYLRLNGVLPPTAQPSPKSRSRRRRPLPRLPRPSPIRRRHAERHFRDEPDCGCVAFCLHCMSERVGGRCLAKTQKWRSLHERSG